MTVQAEEKRIQLLTYITDTALERINEKWCQSLTAIFAQAMARKCITEGMMPVNVSVATQTHPDKPNLTEVAITVDGVPSDVAKLVQRIEEQRNMITAVASYINEPWWRILWLKLRGQYKMDLDTKLW